MTTKTDTETERRALQMAIRDRLARVSPRWQDALGAEGDMVPIPDLAVRAELALGVASIHEGHRLHAGQAGVLRDDTPEPLCLLIGDHLYAAGLCDVAQTGELEAVRTLAGLIADVAALTDPENRDAGAAERAALWEIALPTLR